MDRLDSYEIFSIFSRIFGGRRGVFTFHYQTPSGVSFYRRVCRECRGGDCGSCTSGRFLQLSPKATEGHILGQTAVGIYPVDEYGRCRFAVIELKGKNFKMQLRVLASVCQCMELSHLCEITDYGKSSRLWLIFSGEITAAQAAGAAAVIIKEGMAVADIIDSSLLLSIQPSPIPKGDLGCPVMLPLFHLDSGFSRLTNNELEPIDDPLEFLAEFQGTANLPKPIKPDKDDFPDKIKCELCNRFYIDTPGISQKGIDALRALATVPNPCPNGEFQPPAPPFSDYSGLSRARLYLPRGVGEKAVRLLEEFSQVKIADRRERGKDLRVKLKIQMPSWVINCVDELADMDCRTITGSVGSGKGNVVCALIEHLRRSTLILAAETRTAYHWRKVVSRAFGIDEKEIPLIINDDASPQGRLDIALLDSRTELRIGDCLPFYGVVIIADIDRLHCGPEVFADVMACVCAKRIYAVSTVPVRDGRCGEAAALFCGDDYFLHSQAQVNDNKDD